MYSIIFNVVFVFGWLIDLNTPLISMELDLTEMKSTLTPYAEACQLIKSQGYTPQVSQLMQEAARVVEAGSLSLEANERGKVAKFLLEEKDYEGAITWYSLALRAEKPEYSIINYLTAMALEAKIKKLAKLLQEPENRAQAAQELIQPKTVKVLIAHWKKRQDRLNATLERAKVIRAQNEEKKKIKRSLYNIELPSIRIKYIAQYFLAEFARKEELGMLSEQHVNLDWLQGLCFYAQAAALRLFNQPLFPEEIKRSQGAELHIKELYELYEKLKEISISALEKKRALLGMTRGGVGTLLEGIYRRFGKISPKDLTVEIQLSGTVMAVRPEDVIPHALIKRVFKREPWIAWVDELRETIKKVVEPKAQKVPTSNIFLDEVSYNAKENIEDVIFAHPSKRKRTETQQALDQEMRDYDSENSLTIHGMEHNKEESKD